MFIVRLTAFHFSEKEPAAGPAAVLPFPALYKLSVIAVNVLPTRSALSGANFESQKFRVTNRTRHLAYIAVLVTLFLSVTAI